MLILPFSHLTFSLSRSPPSYALIYPQPDYPSLSWPFSLLSSLRGQEDRTVGRTSNSHTPAFSFADNWEREQRFLKLYLLENLPRRSSTQHHQLARDPQTVPWWQLRSRKHGCSLCSLWLDQLPTPILTAHSNGIQILFVEGYHHLEPHLSLYNFSKI